VVNVPSLTEATSSRRIAVVGAPSSIGIRPYDDGQERHLNRAPGVLRERGLVTRLNAIDLGDVMPPPYKDFARPAGRPRNEGEVFAYSRALAERVMAAKSGRFCLVLGGDCSIVLGCLHGARRKTGDAIGLVYIDAHADFATTQESRTGSVASMCLAMAVGRGDSLLSRLGGDTPLVDPRHVAIVGRRDDHEWYGSSSLSELGVVDLPDATLRSSDPLDVAQSALAPVTAPGVRGFWIQLDADVINPAAMPAVDSPEPGGLMPDQVVRFLTPLVRHPRALGLSLTIYDPALDPDRACARRLVHLLESALAAPALD
jgi:arginase